MTAFWTAFSATVGVGVGALVAVVIWWAAAGVVGGIGEALERLENHITH